MTARVTAPSALMAPPTGARIGMGHRPGHHAELVKLDEHRVER